MSDTHTHTHENETGRVVKDVEEFTAVLEHTIHHNHHHIEDLKKLAVKSEALGYTNAAGKLELTITHFKNANEALHSALKMLKQ